MGIRITTVDKSMEESGLKVLVHGEAGAGKTTMAATTGKPTLIVSAESGLLSIKGAPDYIKVAVVKSLDDMAEVYELLDTTDHGFDWVILDSVSEMGEVVLSQEKKLNKDARAAYGNTIEMMTTMLKRFRDLPINVLMTCKQQRITDDDSGRVTYAPQLPGARLANDLPYLFDEVLALRVEVDEEGQPYRVLQTGTDKKYVAKDRSGMLEMFEQPNLATIYKKIHGDDLPGLQIVSPTAKDIEEAIESRKEAYTRYFWHAGTSTMIVVDENDPVDDDTIEHCTEVTPEQYHAWAEEQSSKGEAD